MDEIGLIVSHIDERGFARVAPVVGVFPHCCAGSRVRFASGRSGVIGWEPREEDKGVPPQDRMYIDVGDAAVFDRAMAVALGKGSAVKVRDNGMLRYARRRMDDDGCLRAEDPASYRSPRAQDHRRVGDPVFALRRANRMPLDSLPLRPLAVGGDRSGGYGKCRQVAGGDAGDADWILKIIHEEHEGTRRILQQEFFSKATYPWIKKTFVKTIMGVEEI